MKSDGIVEYAPLRDGNWKLRLSLANFFTISRGDLFQSDQFLNIRSGEFEETLSVENQWTRHFFLLPRAVVPDTNSFEIHIEVNPLPPNFLFYFLCNIKFRAKILADLTLIKKNSDCILLTVLDIRFWSTASRLCVTLLNK